MYSLTPTLSSLLLAGSIMLASPAFAQSAAYSTDMDEVDVATVHNDSANTSALKEDANVRLNVKHAMYAMVPLKIEVLDENNTQVASFTTHDRIIYMHLPEGHYSIKVNALVQKKTIEVEASDAILKSYAI